MRVLSMMGKVCLLLAMVAPGADAQLRTEVVVQGLSSPVAFVPDPTSPSRFFIVQQAGVIHVLDGGTLLPTPFLDLRGSVLAGGEQGLLGMAFAPDAATSGRFFVYFTKPRANDPGGNDLVVARFRRTPATALTADAGSRFDLVWPPNLPYIPHPSHPNHNGGHLAFGPDGYLYMGTGDGGSGNDPPNNAQNPLSLLGKMLRLDVNVPDDHPTGYLIPPSNPFAGPLPVPVRGEIWDFGLRNPWRYSFDDMGPGATGALIIGDVGQGAREEVDYEPAGAGGRNYGWSLREGTIATPGVTGRSPAYEPLVNPVFDYPRTIGRAVIGGYIYRGAQLPAGYRGRYFLADQGTGLVASVGLAIDPATREARFVDGIDHTAELGSPGRVVSFGRDHQGELYLVIGAGRVLKLVGPAPPGAPTNLQASLSGRTVTLSWTPPSTSGTTGYRLEAGLSPGSANLGTLATGPTPQLTVPGVADGTYFVRVRAERNGVVGPPSSDLEVTVSGCPVPAAPGGLQHTVSDRTVTLTWSSAPGAASYVVEAAFSRGGPAIAQLRVATTSLRVEDAPPGFYFVRVRGLNGCGLSPPSSEVQVQVQVP